MAEETKNEVVHYSTELLTRTFKYMKKTPGKYRAKIQLVRSALNNLKDKQETGEGTK